MSDKRAVLYCRVGSTSQTSDLSIEMQKDILLRFAHSRGYENIECYTDCGYNGLTFSNRPGFMEMQKDIDEGKIDIVIARSECRISRNTADAVRWIERIKSKGVGFIAADHPDMDIKFLYPPELLEKIVR